MPDWIGPGVDTPLLGVVVVAGGVETAGVVLVLELVIRAVVDVDVVDGTGSNMASTQYECPAASVPQVSGMDGFWWWHQRML
jgi:hypothetical protein